MQLNAFLLCALLMWSTALSPLSLCSRSCHCYLTVLLQQIAVHPSGPSIPPNQELPSVDDTLSPHIVSPGEQFPCMSPETTLQTNSSVVLCASESIHPDKSKPLPRLHCELNNQASEQPAHGSPCALASALSLQQELRPRSDSSQAHGEDIPPSEASCTHIPTPETNPGPATGEDGSTDSPTSRPRLEPSAPSGTHGLEVAAGLRKVVAGLSEDSTTPALLSAAAGSQASPGAEGEAPPSPELTENPAVSPGVAEVSRNLALQCVSAWEARRDAPQISPDTLLENLPNASSEVSALQPEGDVSRILTPSIIGVSGLVSLSIVLQVPSALFVIGLLLVLHCL